MFRVTEDVSGPVLEATDLSGQLLFRRQLGLVGPEVSIGNVDAVLDLWSDRLSQSGFGEGVPEADVALPSGFQLKEIRAKELWGIEQDELDVNYVAKLEMIG